MTNVIVEKNVVFCYVFAHLLGPYGSDWAETHRRGRLGWCLPDMFYQLCRQSHLEPTFGRRLIFPTKKIFLSPNFFFFFFIFQDRGLKLAGGVPYVLFWGGWLLHFGAIRQL